MCTYNNNDTLQLYDGNHSMASTLISELSGCHAEVPGPFMTTQQNMFLVFTAGSSYRERGFNATYKSRNFGK